MPLMSGDSYGDKHDEDGKQRRDDDDWDRGDDDDDVHALMI